MGVVEPPVVDVDPPPLPGVTLTFEPLPPISEAESEVLLQPASTISGTNNSSGTTFVAFAAAIDFGLRGSEFLTIFYPPGFAGIGTIDRPDYTGRFCAVNC